MAVEALDPHAREYDALLVVSFGGPEGPDDVLPFLDNVFRGLRVTPETKTHIAKRYARFGGVSPINDHTRGLIATLARDGRVRRAYLGVGAAPRPLPPKAVAALGRTTGIELIDVAAGSPAGLAGLRPEDIVVALNGSPIESVEELQRLLSADTIDAPQSVTVLRAGTVMQLEVRPTELAA